MALPVTIPNTFANATTSIPLSQLDTNFSTLANAVNGINSGSEILANLKSSNVTITGGVISNVTLDNVTVDVETLSNVTINGGNVTVTNMVASTANANTINVTTINARDGTASISLANSTGVLSLSNAIVATAGTSAAPSITFTGDTNTGIFSPAADTIAFTEGGVESMRITSSGNVGIGTTTPSGLLHLSGNTAATTSPTIVLQDSGTTATRLGTLTNDGGDLVLAMTASLTDLRSAITLFDDRKTTFTTNATERMRITSDGEVLVGGTTAIGAAAGILTIQRANTAPSLNLFLNDTTVSSGNVIGEVGFYGNDTTSNTPTYLASIFAQASGTHSAGDNPTDLVFYTTPDGSATAAEVVRFTQAGDVGIGTSSPATTLHTYKSSGTNQLRIASGSATGEIASVQFFGTDSGSAAQIYAQIVSAVTTNTAGSEAGYLGFETQNAGSTTEKMRITSAGEVLIGTTTAASTQGGNLQVITAAAIRRNVASAGGGALRFEKSRSATDGGYTIVQNDDTLGEVQFYGADGVDYAQAASIRGLVNGTPGSNDMPGALAFLTSADGTQSSTERMRIDSSGQVLINTTTNSATSGTGSKFVSEGRLFQVSTYSTNSQESLSMYSTTASAYRFYVGWGGTVFATSATISAISDIRHKENIRDLDVGLAEIMQLQPRVFDWKEGKGKGTQNDRGFIAQEFEQVFPDLIDEWKDSAPDGEEPYKSVRADLIPVLVKAIQELKAELDIVKAELATLKG